MSVPSFARSENKLEAIASTIKMATYTIQMCENEKIFPKKCRWTLCTKIIDTCYDAVARIRQANKIFVKTQEDALLRRELQSKVILDFEALYGFMTIAYELYSIPGEKVDTWAGLILDAENKVSAWRRKDNERNMQKLDNINNI